MDDSLPVIPVVAMRGYLRRTCRKVGLGKRLILAGFYRPVRGFYPEVLPPAKNSEPGAEAMARSDRQQYPERRNTK